MVLKSKTIKSLKRKIYSPDIYAWEWVIVGAIILLTICSTSYLDTQSLTVWSVNVWDVIWEGRPLEFYEYTAQNIHNIQHQYMGCDLFAILPLSIWNIPVWIAQRFLGKSAAENAFLLAWSKLGLEACNVFIAYLGYKMAFLLTNDKKRSLWSVLITLGSGACIIGVCVAGQTDVFVAAYGALCVYNMMKGKKRLAILFAALSIAVKPFFIFAFLPLVLLVEKNVLFAGLDCALSLSVMLFNRVVGNLFPLYKESMSQGPSLSVLKNLFGISVAQASLFVLGVLGLCFLAYMTVTKSDHERNKYLIFIAVGVFLLMGSFAQTEFYRSILIMPYFSVLIVSDMNRLRFNMMIGFIYQFFHTIIRSTSSRFAVSSHYMQSSIVSRFIASTKAARLPEANLCSIVMNADEKAQLYTLLTNASSAVVVAAMIILLVLNYPRFKHKFDLEKNGCFAKFDHCILLLNACVFLPFFIIMYIIYFTF